MIFLYKLLLTFNASSLIIVVYLIKSKVPIHRIIGLIGVEPGKIELVPAFCSYALYFFVPIFTTFISIQCVKYLESDEIEAGQIEEMELANNAFLPSYLGYFFVALSIGDKSTLAYMSGILFVFTFLSQSLYFNPLFLLFGFNFFHIKTKQNVKIFVVTKRELKAPSGISMPELKRINNYTFIDGEKR